MTVRQETGCLVVLTTLPDAERAMKVVRSLVEQRVIACGTILADVTSVYRWKGDVEEATEVQVLFKTRSDRWDELQRAIRALHPYDVPELLAMPVVAGFEDYLGWIRTETVAGEASR